jgi:hypothetical protein
MLSGTHRGPGRKACTTPSRYWGDPAPSPTVDRTDKASVVEQPPRDSIVEPGESDDRLLLYQRSPGNIVTMATSGFAMTV